MLFILSYYLHHFQNENVTFKSKAKMCCLKKCRNKTFPFSDIPRPPFFAEYKFTNNFSFSLLIVFNVFINSMETKNAQVWDQHLVVITSVGLWHGAKHSLLPTYQHGSPLLKKR